MMNLRFEAEGAARARTRRLRQECADRHPQSPEFPETLALAMTIDNGEEQLVTLRPEWVQAIREAITGQPSTLALLVTAACMDYAADSIPTVSPETILTEWSEDRGEPWDRREYPR